MLAVGNTIILLKHEGIFGNDTWNLGIIFIILYMILGSSCMKVIKKTGWYMWLQ